MTPTLEEIAASRAVPGYWRIVTLGGRRWAIRSDAPITAMPGWWLDEIAAAVILHVGDGMLRGEALIAEARRVAGQP